MRTSRFRKIEERQLQGWKLLDRFGAVLERVREQLPATRREEHGLRRLHAEGYLKLFLLGIFNPVVGTMRGLCQASGLPRVQEECGLGAVALSRFSEAQAVFDPELVRRVMSELVAEGVAEWKTQDGEFPVEALRIVDSTLWKVVPRMSWATWRQQHTEQRAVRLHRKLRIFDEAPVEATVTSGDTCERAALRENLQKGEIYLGDRYYGEDYHLLEEMVDKGCDFLFRLRHSAVVRWESQETLDEADRAAGIIQAGVARLGGKHPKGPWRVILLERPGQEPVWLVASGCFEGLRPAEIAEFYRQRWKIEGFFRWLKCLVPCRHWLAQSQPGVQFQVYLSLIAALLLAQVLGERPNRRMMELLHFYHLGWASEEDLVKGLLKAEREARRKRELAAQKKAAAKIA